ncbi:MAG: HupE/UreJ family protein [Bacteroidota bacterium]
MQIFRSGKFLPVVILLFAVLLPSTNIWAHNVNVAMEKAPPGEVFWFYLTLGVIHIVPYGLDHIVFIIALCLLNTKLKSILWQATAFTVAHSVTLALSSKNIIVLPAEIVEPIIALSIVFVAVENILIAELKGWRVLIVFLFGLIHGLGFAAALDEIGLPRNQFFNSIISFNIGVELGQIFVIALVYWLVTKPFGKKWWYRKRVVVPVSVLIAAVATWWTIERIFL